MDQNPSQSSAESGSPPHIAEGFGKVPQPSANFGNVPQPSEGFRMVPHVAERKENHTLTVREVARRFEAAEVARTERSIVNWCQRDAQGFGKLDAYFDTNERKYFITPASVELAIAEERAKGAKNSTRAEASGNVPKETETKSRGDSDNADDAHELELKFRDLEITNRVKDQVIGMKDEAIKRLQEEQHQYIERLIESGHRVGELEAELRQLNAPAEDRPHRLEGQSGEVRS